MQDDLVLQMIVPRVGAKKLWTYMFDAGVEAVWWFDMDFELAHSFAEPFADTYPIPFQIEKSLLAYEHMTSRHFLAGQGLFSLPNYVRDLRDMQRDMSRVIALDRLYETIPEENVCIIFDEDKDKEKITPELERFGKFVSDVQLFNVDDVRPYIKRYNSNRLVDPFAEEHAAAAHVKTVLDGQSHTTEEEAPGWLEWMGWKKKESANTKEQPKLTMPTA
jgi:hypothetical protein